MTIRAATATHPVHVNVKWGYSNDAKGWSLT